jgi:hypothetical protein
MPCDGMCSLFEIVQGLRIIRRGIEFWPAVGVAYRGKTLQTNDKHDPKLHSFDRHV